VSSTEVAEVFENPVVWPFVKQLASQEPA